MVSTIVVEILGNVVRRQLEGFVLGRSPSAFLFGATPLDNVLFRWRRDMCVVFDGLQALRGSKVVCKALEVSSLVIDILPPETGILSFSCFLFGFYHRQVLFLVS